MTSPDQTQASHDEEQRLDRLLDRFAFSLAAAIAIGFTLRQVNDPFPRAVVWSVVGSILAVASVPVLRRMGVRSAAAMVMPLTCVVLPFVGAYTQAGLFTPILFALSIAPIAGMFFGGLRGGLLAAAAALVAVGILTYLHLEDHAFAGMRVRPHALASNAARTLTIVTLAATALAYLYESQRKQREAQLRDSHLRYAMAVEGSMDGLYENDLVRATSYYSERFKSLLGYAVDVALDAPLAELVLPDDRALFDAQLASSTSATVDLDLRLRCADGAPRWFQLRGAVWRQDGAVARLAGSIRDISSRKHTEQMKDDFVSSVSHELRTPLTSMWGALQLIQNGAAGPLPQESHALLEVAVRNTHRLRTLVDDLLDFRSLEVGALKLARRRVDLGALLRESVELNRGVADMYAVELRLQVAAPEPEVDADPVRLQQIVTNLISNACKFSPERGAVEIAVRSDAQCVHVTVRDSGPGVPVEFERKLFEKFSQAEGGDTRRHPGTGLGLAICKSLALAHGGDLRYQREAGTTSFELTLPHALKSAA